MEITVLSGSDFGGIQQRQALLDNSWIGAMLYGKEFDDALEIEQGMAAAVTLMLKLQKS